MIRDVPKSSDHDGGRPVPVDYDIDPARFAANQAATAKFSAAGDVHGPVAERLARSAARRLLDPVARDEARSAGLGDPPVNPPSDVPDAVEPIAVRFSATAPSVTSSQ